MNSSTIPELAKLTYSVPIRNGDEEPDDHKDLARLMDGIAFVYDNQTIHPHYSEVGDPPKLRTPQAERCKNCRNPECKGVCEYILRSLLFVR